MPGAGCLRQWCVQAAAAARPLQHFASYVDARSSMPDFSVYVSALTHVCAHACARLFCACAHLLCCYLDVCQRFCLCVCVCVCVCAYVCLDALEGQPLGRNGALGAQLSESFKQLFGDSVTGFTCFMYLAVTLHHAPTLKDQLPQVELLVVRDACVAQRLQSVGTKCVLGAATCQQPAANSQRTRCTGPFCHALNAN